MKIRNKNLFVFLIMLAIGIGWFSWNALLTPADDKGINFTYEIDMDAADSGATTVQGNRTIKDIQNLIGTSKMCMLVFKHTGSGVTKACTVGTAIVLTDNYFLDIWPGAEFTLNANLTVANPGNIIATCSQTIKGGGTGNLLFTTGGLRCPAWDNSGTTTLMMPSAEINTLYLTKGSTTAIREKLTADRIYYVRTDGNNNNTGLVNSAGGAWLTIQHAVDHCRDNIDAGYSGVTIQLGPGTYTEDVKLYDIVGADEDHQGNKKLLILGNYADPSGVTIQGTANCITAVNVYHPWYIDGVVLKSSGSCILADFGGVLYIGKVIFNTAAVYHVNVMYGSKVEFCDDYTINGSALIHIINQWGGIIVFWNSRTITLTGTPAFTFFIYARWGGMIMARDITFSGSATGTRFSATWGGMIDTNNALGTYFPGNASGTTNVCCPWAQGYYN